MRTKQFTLLLIIMITSLLVKPSFAAEKLEMTENLIVTNFTQTYDKNPYDSNGIVAHWNRAPSSYSLEPYQRSGKIDLPIDLPVPLEIDSSDQGLLDPAVRLGLDQKRKEKNISFTFGIKYSFSRFELQHFAKSLVSLFSNMKKDAPRKGSKRNLPISFYLSFPEF